MSSLRRSSRFLYVLRSIRRQVSFFLHNFWGGSGFSPGSCLNDLNRNVASSVSNVSNLDQYAKNLMPHWIFQIKNYNTCGVVKLSQIIVLINVWCNFFYHLSNSIKDKIMIWFFLFISYCSTSSQNLKKAFEEVSWWVVLLII